MQLKSYFSGTLEPAMELARKELGEEALLLNVRPAVGAYEVVAGVVNSPLTPGVLKPPKTPAPLNPLLKSLLSKRQAAA
jgi:flagellar biosynthesis GTPase FlhF